MIFLFLLVLFVSSKVTYTCYKSKLDCDSKVSDKITGTIDIDTCKKYASSSYKKYYCYNKVFVKYKRSCDDDTCEVGCFSSRDFMGKCKMVVDDDDYPVGSYYYCTIEGCSAGKTAKTLHVMTIIFLGIGLIGCCCCLWTCFLPLGFLFFAIAMMAMYGVC